MTSTLTVELSPDGSEAVAALRAAGIDPATVAEAALLREANRVVGRTLWAVEHHEAELIRPDSSTAHELPMQIEHVRPPR